MVNIPSDTSMFLAVSCRLGAAAFAAFAAQILILVPAYAQDARKLEDLINQYRASSPVCHGKQARPAGALMPDASLARLKLERNEPLDQALKRAGIRMARAEAVVVSGPASADAAMEAIRQKYCETLLRQEFTLIGTSRTVDTWRVILARPLLAPSLGSSTQAGKTILELVNAARATPRVCGSKRFPAAPRLRWNDRLANAALAHSTDMASRNYFRHQDNAGGTAAQRVQRAGYRWQRIGENIAAGQGSPQEAMTGWLASPGHCANIMNADFAEMGAGFATSQKSDAGIYWTQVFGTPR